MSTRLLNLALLPLTALTLWGCTSVATTDREIRDNILVTLEEAAAEIPAPAATRDLLLPPPSAPAAAPEGRFDITVDQAPAREFLLSLVTQTDVNLIVHPDVEATVSLELRNVTVEDVLDVLQEIYGLSYQKTRVGYIVRPPRLENRIYEVNYLDIDRRGTSRTRISSGQSTENTSLLDDTLLTGTQTSHNRSGGNDDDKPTGTRVSTTTESTFWSSLEVTLARVLGCEVQSATQDRQQSVRCSDGRNLMLSPQSGVISIQAMPDEHQIVGELLRSIEENVQRQVILEARIIEVELSDAFRSGINWQLLDSIDGHPFSFGQAAGANLFGKGTSNIAGLSASDLLTSFNPAATGGVNYFSYSSTDFNAFIELLETQGSTRVLSSPRVSTVNNQKAVIKVGTDEFFVTGVTSRTAAGGTGSTAASSVELTPFFSGIALDVTPQVSRNGEVILHIHPTVSEVTDQTKTFTVSGEEESLPLAFSSVRESDSIIRASNGQLVVIGGLMKDSATRNRGGLPLLGRIPGLGNAFSNRAETSRKTELVILLRPIVVNNANDWSRHADEPLRRVRDMGRSLPQ